ncbi:MAG: hypothetical protein KDD65_19040, partial [Bacteroidetes bacterium]|nr:hypothetical protein [Bacteroidota bacterium]
DAQVKGLSQLEQSKLHSRLRATACPWCGSTEASLNMLQIAYASSFVFLTNYKSELVLACPDCLQKMAKENAVSTAIFGWWGIPWGPIRTIQAIRKNAKVRSYDWDRNAPSEELEAFLVQKPGVAISIVETSAADV